MKKVEYFSGQRNFVKKKGLFKKKKTKISNTILL